jgi:hypothetical protein
MINNLSIQTALVAYLKSKAAITAVVSVTEIREDQWQGTEFSYPNIRVRMISNRPRETNCDVSEVNFAIQIFSQQDSSIEAEQIAVIINTALHARSFESVGIRFSVQTMNQIPAFRQDVRTWRSELLMRATATG